MHRRDFIMGIAAGNVKLMSPSRRGGGGGIAGELVEGGVGGGETLKKSNSDPILNDRRYTGHI